MENHKSQLSNPKEIPTANSQNAKPYDLQERTLLFAKNVRDYIKVLPKSSTNYEFSKQLIRSAGSVGANYIEADEALGRKDFLLRLRTSRKECKESRYWLILTEPQDGPLRDQLVQEASELLKILSAIIEKTQ